MLKIYNTLTRKIEVFKPQNPPLVTIYTCGPTVYDHAHIGHWFNYVRMDLLIRALRANQYRPKWVINITDVGHLTSDQDEGEDKIQKKANNEHKSAWQIARYYEKEFLSSWKELNILDPSLIVRATEHINDQIELILKLQKKGFTYKIENDGIYYDTSKFKDYSKFARLDIDQQQPGKRVEFNPLKRNPSDFSLWKFSPKDQHRDMEWDSPFGKGFPGWHIECSAMSMKYLGDTLDFHTGGIDHIPIHHTNEIAQSQAITKKPLANYWMHSNHVTINNQKISKSLGNGITLDQLTKLAYDPMEIRLHILESHYQNQSKFSLDSLDSAKRRYQDLRAMSVLRYQLKNNHQSFNFKNIIRQLRSYLLDNLNSPKVLAYLSPLTDQILESAISKNQEHEFNWFLSELDQLLGLKLTTIPDIDDNLKKLLNERQRARQLKDFSKSDKIREQLKENKIIIEDRANDYLWRWE
jgi:cysteinyl-tRNA synthetase